MNKIGCGCFDKQDTQAQTADPVKKWSIKMSAVRGWIFFPVSVPGKRRVKALLFLWGKKGIGGYWIPAFAGMTERGDTGMTSKRKGKSPSFF